MSFATLCLNLVHAQLDQIFGRKTSVEEERSTEALTEFGDPCAAQAAMPSARS